MGILVNIDNGGTFTDVCIRDGRRIVHAKTPTTPHDLTQCFVSSLRRASQELYGDEDLGRLLRETDYLRYSTTAGTNAVVERKGVPVGLIVERGEEDTVYGARTAIDAGLWRALVVGEPVGLPVEDGEVDGRDLTDVVNRLIEAGAQRLVVALRAPAAEGRVKALLLEKYPRHLLGAVPFLVSSELVGDDDHARRTITALLNSYLHPGMEHFLYGAEQTCRANRMPRPLLIFRNDGNSARVAKTTAIKTWGSGPRGGIEGVLAYARRYGEAVLAGMDIGGTTLDVAVAAANAVRLHPHGRVESARISFPLPEMRSHGLGGSSVVSVVDGAIVIGPESVGAVPGPACFGRGGTSATLTDALLLAGVIDGERYLGGELRLDAARAEAAIGHAVATPLGLPPAAAVAAVIQAFERQAGDCIRTAVAEAGHRPEEATLLAFGGGGPMIASGIAEAAGVRRVIVPHMAAVFSAFGIGFSNLAHEYQAPLPAGGGTDALRRELLHRARLDMAGEGVDADACDYAFALVSEQDGGRRETPLDGGDPVDAAAATHLALRAAYRLPVFALQADGALPDIPAPTVGEAAVGTADGGVRSVPVHRAEALEPGHHLTGPALVRGAYLTCLVRPGWRLRVTPNRDLLIEASAP